jgi:hypothetical protein
MTENLRKTFIDFLLRAKRSTYAAGGEESDSSRPLSHDLRYEEEDGWLYIDSYLGGERFVGEEAVWKDGAPIWAMNYSGRVIGKGFDGAFLKEALLRVSENTPYRGPIEYQDGPLLYCNTSAGAPDWFFGREEIFRSGVSIYECIYHGGVID